MRRFQAGWGRQIADRRTQALTQHAGFTPGVGQQQDEYPVLRMGDQVDHARALAQELGDDRDSRQSDWRETG